MKGARGVHYEKLVEMDNTAVTAGNMSDCSSNHVIQQAVYEYKSKEKLSKDNISDVIQTKELL